MSGAYFWYPPLPAPGGGATVTGLTTVAAVATVGAVTITPVSPPTINARASVHGVGGLITNLMPNPSFETNTTGWVGVNSATIATSSVDATSGSQSMRISTAAGQGELSGASYSTPSKVSLGGGTTAAHTFTAHVSTDEASIQADVSVAYYDTGGGALNSSIESYVAVGGTPIRITKTLTPSGGTATHATVLISFKRTSGDFTAGQLLYVDAVVVSLGDTVWPYFDGSLSDTSTHDYTWTGTAHASASTVLISGAVIRVVDEPPTIAATATVGSPTLRVVEEAVTVAAVATVGAPTLPTPAVTPATVAARASFATYYFAITPPSSLTVSDCKYLGGVWVAIGHTGVSTGQLATTDDIILNAFTINTSLNTAFGGSNVSGITYGNGVWVVVGSSGKIATATDPEGTWTLNGTTASEALSDVHYANGVFVAVGGSGASAGVIYTATDATSTWTSRTPGVNEQLESITYEPSSGRWLATHSTDPTIEYAADPTSTWNAVTVTGAFVFGGIAVDGAGTAVAAGDGDHAYSTNGGTSWTRVVDNVLLEDSAGIAYGGGQWVLSETDAQELYIGTDPTAELVVDDDYTTSLGSGREIRYTGGYFVQSTSTNIVVFTAYHSPLVYVPPSVPDATVTPVRVAAVATVGSPTIAAGSLIAAASVSAVATVGVPTLIVREEAVTVAATTTVGSPTLAAGSLVSAVRVAGVATVGAPTLAAGVLIAATVVPATATVGSPTLAAGVGITATSVSATATVGTPTFVLREEAVTVAAVATVGAPTLAAGVLIAATVVPVTTTVGAPTLAAGVLIGATAVSAVATVGAPTIQAQADATVTPSTVAGTATVGAPGIGAVVSPAVLQYVRNANMELGTNANWNGTYDGTELYAGHGTIKGPIGDAIISSDYEAIDPTQTFLAKWAYRADGTTGQSYRGLMPVDRDILQIRPWMVWYQAGTTTTLAADLVNGAGTITLTSAANWYEGTTSRPCKSSVSGTTPTVPGMRGPLRRTPAPLLGESGGGWAEMADHRERHHPQHTLTRGDDSRWYSGVEHAGRRHLQIHPTSGRTRTHPTGVRIPMIFNGIDTTGKWVSGQTPVRHHASDSPPQHVQPHRVRLAG